MSDVRHELGPPFVLQLLDPAVRADPYPHYRRFRTTDPIASSPIGIWVLSRHRDILAVLRDERFSSDPRSATAVPDLSPPDQPTPIRDAAGTALLFTDPPDHTRIRGLVNRAFTARRVRGMAPFVQDLVDDLLDEAARADEVDVIRDLAYPLPVLVICELLGVPPEDREKHREWSRELAPVLDPINPPDVAQRAVDAVSAFRGYFADLVAQRRAEPRDDLLSALIAAEDEEGRLSEDELLSICVLLFVAGHETTQNLIGNGLMALLRHRDQLELWREQPETVGRNGVEELLRYDSPVQLTARSALEPVEIDGRRIAAGEQCILLLGAGNRDPEAFPEPDSVDLRRENVSHLSFGGGIHFCVGAALARLEGEIALSTLLLRHPGIELAGEPEWRATLTLHGLKRLPVSLG